MKSHTQEEIVTKELKMTNEVAKIKKEGLKHCHEIITKVDVEINFKNRKSKHQKMNNNITCMKNFRMLFHKPVSMSVSR